MTTLLISPKSYNELKFIEDFLHKIGVVSKELSKDEKEELGISILMKQADRSRRVSRETIMKKLRS